MKVRKQNFIGPFFEAIVAFIVLGIILANLYAYFVLSAYSGVVFNSSTGEVTKIITANGLNLENDLKIGDYLLQVGGVLYKDYQTDLNVTLFQGYQKGDEIPIRVSRNGQEVNLQYLFPGVSSQGILNRLNSQWNIPLFFWLAGTAALLFFRPRNKIRSLFYGFCYITSIWLSAGDLSSTHLFWSPILMRSATWLALPIYLNLHWLFPMPFKKLSGWLTGSLYAFSALMIAGEIFQVFPKDLYIIGFLILMMGSLILLILHAIYQPETRKVIRWLLLALGLVVLPMVGLGVLLLFDITPWFAGAMMLGISALPGFYFYTIYQQQLGSGRGQFRRLFRVYFLIILVGVALTILVTFLPNPFLEGTGSTGTIAIPFAILSSFEAIASFAPFLILPALSRAEVKFATGRESGFIVRANRAASGVFFFLLLIPVMIILAVLVNPWVSVPESAPIAIAFVGFTGGIIAIATFKPFGNFFDRKVLAIPLRPETILKTYSGRIATCLDLGTLRALLVKEVMPSLLVRQFAIYVSQGTGVDPFEWIMGTPTQEKKYFDPDNFSAEIDPDRWKRNRLPEEAPTEWKPQILPLRVENRIIGYVILGHRDPDDQYPSEDVDVFQVMADQTALALRNIAKTESLKAFYLADINRQEVERIQLAAELHDDVLNQLAIMTMNLDLDHAPAKAAYDEAINHIREIIKGLRPDMLKYGLSSGLYELTDELSERYEITIENKIDGSENEIRFSDQIELHIFRIVQQAIQNAISHSKGTRITLSGRIQVDDILLTIEDNGMGFNARDNLNLNDLLANKHFGLAGMIERAEFIGAEVSIESSEGKGTLIRVTWLPAKETA